MNHSAAYNLHAPITAASQPTHYQYEPVLLDSSSIEKPNVLSRTFAKTSRLSLVFGVFLLVLTALPVVTSKMRVSSANRQLDKALVTMAASDHYQPLRDDVLPITNHISIPSIGVDSQIHEANIENYEDALKEGVWRVQDYGTPYSRQNPTILIAHRFGYLAWSNQFRRENSFYNLPKLKVGDMVEIVWHQRKYVYEVYAEGEGDKIEDFEADLILYTCKILEGDTRIFKYAKLLEI